MEMIHEAQSVEKPGCALSGSRVSGVFGAEKAEKQDVEMKCPQKVRQIILIEIVQALQFCLDPAVVVAIQIIQEFLLDVFHRLKLL